MRKKEGGKEDEKREETKKADSFFNERFAFFH